MVLERLQDFTAKSKETNCKQTADEIKAWFQFLPKSAGFVSMDPFDDDFGLLVVMIAHPMAITHFIGSDGKTEFLTQFSANVLSEIWTF